MPCDASSSNWPLSSSSPSPAKIVAFLLLAEAQIPTTEFLFNGSVGLEPLRVSCFFETCIAIVCTLNPLVLSTPGAAVLVLSCRFRHHLSVARSTLHPRSTSHP